MMGKGAKAGMALVWAAALVGGAAAPALAQTKELSDKSVLTLMHYAWGMVPQKFTTPLGKIIEVDKTKPSDVDRAAGDGARGDPRRPACRPTPSCASCPRSSAPTIRR